MHYSFKAAASDYINLKIILPDDMNLLYSKALRFDKIQHELFLVDDMKP